MTTLDDVAALLGQNNGLVVVSTVRADDTVQSSLVNAGVLTRDGQQVLGFVARGGTRKVANLRKRPNVTAVAQAGWAWAAVEGRAQIVGPDDPVAGVDDDALRLLLREIFAAAGGTHDDWDEYDAVMAAERRAAVLIAPARVYSNG
jgi:PPOX class probable F420-dependent enzyme